MLTYEYVNAGVFGSLVRSARIALGVTQVRLAECSQVSVTGVAMIERGERLPRLDTAQRLALSLGKTLSQMLEGY